MTAAAAIVALSALCVEEEVFRASIPADTSVAHAFLFQGDEDAAPEWGVVDGELLRIAKLGGASVDTIALPAGTGLFDLRDTNADGIPELIALTETGLCRWTDAATAVDTSPDWCVRDARFEALSAVRPTPYRLVRDDPARVRVPLQTPPFEWTLDSGVELQGITAAAVQGAPPITRAWSVVHSRRDGPLHTRIEFDVGYRGVLPPPETMDDRVDAQGTQRAIEAKKLNAAMWPSFPLTREGTTEIHFALDLAASNTTLIRFQRLAGLTTATQVEFTAPRRYPGILVAPTDAPPDFNGDGFADLLLWNAAPPGRTVGSWIRAAQRRTWDVTLTVHLYDPVTARYRARPDSSLSLEAPIAGVLRGGVLGPIPVMRLEDANRDGRTDLIRLTPEGELSIRLYAAGWKDDPIVARFDEPVVEVVLTASYGESGWMALLKSGRAFHVVALAEDEFLFAQPGAEPSR